MGNAHEFCHPRCEPAVALLPSLRAMALRHAQPPPSEAASRRSPCQPRPCASTGGEVALGQATSCFEAAADHGGLVRGVAVLPPDHAAGAAARPPQLEGESQVATLLSSRTSTCAPLPRRTRWPPACRPARPSSSALSASPRGSSAAPSVTIPRHKRRGRSQGTHRTPYALPCDPRPVAPAASP